MFRQKNVFILIIISIMFGNTGCNLVISMVDSNSPPVAIAGKDYKIYVNKTAELDGKDSYDPDGDKLLYIWSIQSKPQDSHLENRDIKNRYTETGSAILDKQGKYEFKLTVSDDNGDSSDVLIITAVPDPGVDPTGSPIPSETPELTPGPTYEPTPELTSGPGESPEPTPELSEPPEPTDDPTSELTSEPTESPEPTPELTGGPADSPGPTPEVTTEPTPNPSPPFGMTLEYLCNGNANDTSEYGNHGVVNGAALFPDRNDSVDKAYFFNNSEDYIDCGNGYSLNTYYELTILLWIRPNNLKGGVILSKRENIDTGYELRLDSGTIAFSEGSSILAASVLGDEKLDKWFHVAVTWRPLDKVNLPSIYIDGSKAWVNNGPQPETFLPSSGHLFIGKSDFRIDDNYRGAVDDIRIYDRVLTEEEIQNIMNIVQ